MLPKSSAELLVVADGPAWTLPWTTNLSNSTQFAIGSGSVGHRSVPVLLMPGPWTRTRLKPVGEPTTLWGVTLSPMKPAGGGAPMPNPPYVSQVRNGPMRPGSADRKSSAAGAAEVCVRQDPCLLRISPRESEVHVNFP